MGEQIPTGQFCTDVADPTRWTDDYGESLYAYALSRVSDPTLAEDLVQETFLAGLKAVGTYRGESSLLTWLTGILRRKIADEFRSRERRPRQQAASPEEEADYTFFNRRGKWSHKVCAWRLDPREIAQSREFWEIFERCVGRLPPTLSAAFQLKQLDGLEARDVCSALQITDSNLSVRMHRARLSLRECLDQNWVARSE